MPPAPAIETMAFDHVAQQVPDVAAAVEWYARMIPGARVLYQDDSWAFVEAGGTKIAFIQQGHHPDHIAWRVSEPLLEQLAASHGRTVRTHRDRTRSFYIQSPGGQWVEFIAYPPDAAYEAR
jgi:catechol 2,3-dioxygenase-like lactoylglutathione lyase family enzyme